MENKKTLKVNCAACDVRRITEDLLSSYAGVKINAANLITSPAAQALLGRYGVQLNCANTLPLEENVRFSTVNGPMTISAGQTPPEEKLVVSVNGPLTLEPGCEEVLRSYASMVVNGPVTCPASMTPLLAAFQVNGPVQAYPDGAIVLKRSTILDRVFHLRARQGALYYAAKQIVALAPGIRFDKLAEKNVCFTTKTLLVAESLTEAAVPLFDDKTDIVILPDGCAYVDGDAELDAGLLKRYGGKLYIGGDLTVGPDAAELLDQVSCLTVKGTLWVCRGLRDRVLELDASYGELRVVGGVLIRERASLELTAGLLADAADGVSITECANVTIAADVTPELLRTQLVSISESIVFCASQEQMDALQPLAEECAISFLSDAEDSGEKESGDEDAVKINAAFYAF